MRGIELSKRHRERFEQVREECDESGVPKPTDEQVMKGLLDTWDAVNDGHYSGIEREDVTDRGKPFVLQLKTNGRPSGELKLAGEYMAGGCGYDRDGTIAALEEAINNDDVTVEVRR